MVNIKPERVLPTTQIPRLRKRDIVGGKNRLRERERRGRQKQRKRESKRNPVPMETVWPDGLFKMVLILPYTNRYKNLHNDLINGQGRLTILSKTKDLEVSPEIKQIHWGNGCAVVGRAVASNTSDPRFESSNRQFYWLSTVSKTVLNRLKKIKVAKSRHTAKVATYVNKTRGRDWPNYWKNLVKFTREAKCWQIWSHCKGGNICGLNKLQSSHVFGA